MPGKTGATHTKYSHNINWLETTIIKFYSFIEFECKGTGATQLNCSNTVNEIDINFVFYWFN